MQIQASQDAVPGDAIPECPRAAALGLRLRPMTPEDMGFLHELYASTREWELAPLPWSSEQKAAFVDMQFRVQHSHYMKHYPDALWLIIELEGEAAGRLYLERWPAEHRIIDISLMPAMRNRGFGSALLGDLLDEAAACARAVGIHVEKTNPALRLYRRLGFEIAEDKGVYDLLKWRPPAQ
ncbi:GNAT family N-acetyltransferase [Hoeflea olei]|uniref:GCN5 family acetyltransferase n=1 Tax=Hoeflea olei TaxID=1480615 RepID=A0A1C1YU32_9HYPH|nr:GNAT family N-acetyltransferase [Hoeflea olei]OCW56917.1 GCN5 family acetyltransferase [Hoeflea olei]